MTIATAARLTRMKADTVRARLRLGMDFPSAVHVPEDLRIRDPTVTELCDALCVDGDLDLAGCSLLRSLPKRLVVRGKLTIDGCELIEALPESLREVFGLSAKGCRRLLSLSPLRECRGPLDFTGCTSLTALPNGFRATDSVEFDDCRIDENSLFIMRKMPETILNAALGRRIGELLTHSVLQGHPVLDAVITSVLVMESWGGAIFDAPMSALVTKSQSK